ncbi:type IV pili twitching motility protein PilT [Candidatus Nomurabacteria bacterium RIFCSPHIGHO2_02_FULL_41_18]|uniref:Type IV pili twitching motility protein PilT n=1 Tax=Candidatus Nomurabacteria bacterium RIFCSPHIGHO2_02_FULL_41_18 TaxID=1801754 RepID=A0A1F6W7G7_9BACT|nr:MAG: type IV pili twitching motility protein PilT [Candidatus Nomurabacteria bacterium RIFCSPHIGHO2_01_FULL_41_71]OGI77858.1 MAG: type IV pili twitching motility protein PilT [Candidatus Nomurabacteria bacterium RIFCSPHIGHO2_02_FULL_41_18]OGI90037.1 MAG: type IV pili twitching motility protein PilT [Candidatus Nomurabacteria bacterium RIFCSPLOWO2_01_FULL_41_52b]OGJ00114.1 MAG: type IV pili twitching motility protein PilT [Candidatus Nomurabacteria bacterium RIFCSPLOWO2_02_FULL_41_9]
MDYQKKLEGLITTLTSEGGSDLHLGVSRTPAIRVFGELIFLAKHPVLSKEDMLGIMSVILDKSKIEKFMENQELDFAYNFREHNRFRGNAFFQKGLISIVLRLIPPVQKLADLNLPPILMDIARKKQGFFLVVGPVGQGKSTTLASMVNVINGEQARNIITIEDPIEHMHIPEKSIISQREVGIDTKDFSTALKYVFREDVNVIMIGEMRNPETVSAAVTAAETGHLVLSTLHTNNASQTLNRIIDSFPSNQQEQIRTQIASSLLGIFSQRLVPRISGGLIPAYELLLNNNAVANLIRENRVYEIDVVIETGSESGMVDLNRSLVALVRAGEITIESAYQYSLNPEGLQRMI